MPQVENVIIDEPACEIKGVDEENELTLPIEEETQTIRTDPADP